MEQVAGESRVAEVPVARNGRDHVGHSLPAPVAEDIVVLRRIVREDLRKFFVGVVAEVPELVEPAAQAGVRLDELRHLLGVASDDHGELAPAILHRKQQCRDALGPYPLCEPQRSSSVYTSSMNNTPPIAFSMTLSVLGVVWPVY